jgi:GDP-L-fucose synthase
MNEFESGELRALRDGKIFVAGHRGMVGSAMVRELESKGCDNLLLRSRQQLNLTDQRQVHDFMQAERPDYVILAAARVGGIHANNTYPAQFIYDNLMIACNIINAAHKAAASRLLFLGSSCIYPRMAPQPMHESALLTGQLEPTNEPYAIAKIAGIKLCESYNREYGTDYRSLMPTNLYGQNDNFDLEKSHVLPALIRKFHEAKLNGAKSVEVWGTGKPRREFLHVDDLASASVFVLTLSKSVYESATRPMQSHINAGMGTDVAISELADIVKAVTGFEGDIVYNTEYPDGTPQKLLDVSTLTFLGWQAGTSLKDGIRKTYEWYCQTAAKQ